MVQILSRSQVVVYAKQMQYPGRQRFASLSFRVLVTTRVILNPLYSTQNRREKIRKRDWVHSTKGICGIERQNVQFEHAGKQLRRRRRVWSRSTFPLASYSVFTVPTLHYAVTLTFDLWPWTFTVTWWNSVRYLNLIGQSVAELLQFEYLTLWSWTRITCSAMLWDSLHKL